MFLKTLKELEISVLKMFQTKGITPPTEVQLKLTICPFQGFAQQKIE